MTHYNVRDADTRFLSEAVTGLLEARRALEWSYVYGFYLPKGTKEKNHFEYLQEDLEKYTNALSEAYELPPEKVPEYQDFIKWKQEVSNYTRVTKKFLDHFLDGVAGGLTSNTL